MAAGVAASVAAGAMWGLVFLAPKLAGGFAPLQLSAARYLAYGLFAACLILPGWRGLAARLEARDWWRLAWLGLTGNIVYYVFLANAVQRGGVAMAALVIGLLPVSITLAGRRDRDAAPLRRLVPSLLLSAAGLVCITWESVATQGRSSLAGLLCGLGALACWTVYAVANSRALARLTGVSAREWSLLTGVVTGLEALVLAVPAVWIEVQGGGHAGADWLRFAWVTAAVALFCSVVGNALWNRASRLLPLTLMGQMIVFETLFGALYGFLWERRWPTPLEDLALLLLMAGVAACAAVHRTPPAPPP
jgi:drug/metabolite transporter (DMT)-like permease